MSATARTIASRCSSQAASFCTSFASRQKFIYIADGAQLSSFGRTGRMAGEFKWVHNIAIDRQGNLYTSEVGFGRRVQKFNLVSF